MCFHATFEVLIQEGFRNPFGLKYCKLGSLWGGGLEYPFWGYGLKLYVFFVFRILRAPIAPKSAYNNIVGVNG